MKQKLRMLSYVMALGAVPVLAEKLDDKSQSNQQAIQTATVGWPVVTALAAKDLIQQYGLPNDISQNQLVWYNTAPFKRTILHRTPVKHNFPEAHEDFLEQVIDYSAPLSRYDNIVRFDGSVKLDRTAGEMSAKCHIPAANLLALNLAHKVATYQMSARKARKEFVSAIKMNKRGLPPVTMRALLIPSSLTETADPDKSVIED